MAARLLNGISVLPLGYIIDFQNSAHTQGFNEHPPPPFYFKSLALQIWMIKGMALI